MIDFHIIIPVAHAAEEVIHEAANTGIAGTFGIDWMKFLGQFINFGIALFILWKWVFTPVTAALQKRTEKIEKSLQDASDIAKEKEEFTKWRNVQMVNARHEASTIVSKAQTDATMAKDDILHKAKQEQEKLVEDAKKRIENEKNKQLEAAKGELADLVTNATEKILRQKLDGKKDAELIKESLKEIK